MFKGYQSSQKYYGSVHFVLVENFIKLCGKTINWNRPSDFKTSADIFFPVNDVYQQHQNKPESSEHIFILVIWQKKIMRIRLWNTLEGIALYAIVFIDF